MTIKTVFFLGALGAVGLAIAGKIKMSHGIGIGIGLVIVANLIPDTTSSSTG